ncbi:MAG: ferredoxin--NADP reductase [Candidatus Kapabacteria bacterium]|nr:ferredoxin--NADP reductase [Candidatus Kapabacteria bacterium]
MDSPLYNATVIGKILITPDLMVLRVKTDEPRTEFRSGQFTAIGLLSTEPRSDNSVAPFAEIEGEKLIKRPYSIASENKETTDFEFYVSQVKSGQLTPRLFNLKQGDRMWVDNRIVGIFTLDSTPSDNNIVMVATGTGLAPYISFLRSHIADHAGIKMAVIQGAAFQWDLGYYSELTFIQKAFKNFFYMPTLIKADDSWTGLHGYIEDIIAANKLQNMTGIEINPEKTHFFLCGNPHMVESVSKILTDNGYTKHTKKVTGSLHVEEW